MLVVVLIQQNWRGNCSDSDSDRMHLLSNEEEEGALLLLLLLLMNLTIARWTMSHLGSSDHSQETCQVRQHAYSHRLCCLPFDGSLVELQLKKKYNLHIIAQVWNTILSEAATSL